YAARVEGDQVESVQDPVVESGGVERRDAGDPGASEVEHQGAPVFVRFFAGGVPGHRHLECTAVRLIGVERNGDGTALQCPHPLEVGAGPGESCGLFVAVACRPVDPLPGKGGLRLPHTSCEQEEYQHPGTHVPHASSLPRTRLSILTRGRSGGEVTKRWVEQTPVPPACFTSPRRRCPTGPGACRGRRWPPTDAMGHRNGCLPVCGGRR